jgi:hypothetical protein
MSAIAPPKPSKQTNNYPKLHNAMWPGLVGKGSPLAEPCIDLDTMLDLTAQANVGGVKFDGVDLFLFDPHVSIESTDDDLKRLSEKIMGKGLVIGSVVAPVWEPTGGGSAMGSTDERRKFLGQIEKACKIAKKLRELGVRPHGVVRIDSACSPADWAKDECENTKRVVSTFAEAGRIASEMYGECLAAEGEICWGGMHSHVHLLKLLEEVGMPDAVGAQIDMAHTLLFLLGYNAPEHRIVPTDFRWEPRDFHEAMLKLTDGLRPWLMDFHVAQNDTTVKGSGTHDKTGRHCLPFDPNGKLHVVRDAGYWLRDSASVVTRKCRHICWDGCMFPNAVLGNPTTWNDILAAMIQVRKNHGWYEEPTAQTLPELAEA